MEQTEGNAVNVLGGRERHSLGIVLFLVATAVAGAWLVLLAAHAADRFLVNHASGVWMGLAHYARDGLLYPPLAADGHYGGTRYMPVPVGLYTFASAITDNYLASGKVLGHLEVAVTCVLAIVTMRRIGASWALSLGLLAVFLASEPALIAGHGLRQDALPLALQLAAIMIVGRGPSRRGAATSGVLCGLALLSKLTAVWALVAIPVWCLATRRPGSIPWFAVAFTGSVVVGLTTVQLLSEGRFLESMLATAASTDAGLMTIAGAPLRAGRLITERALGVSQVLPFAALAVIVGVRRGTVSIYLAAWLASAGVLVATLAHPGAQWNHVVDLALLTVIGAAHAEMQPAFRLPSAGGVLLAIVVVWATATAAWTYLAAPAADAVRAGRAGSDSGYLGEDLGQLGEYIGPGDRILSEDPGISVLLGQDPVILDPYVFRSLAPYHPDWVTDLTGRLQAHDFDAVVLLRDPTGPEAREFYRDVHLGEEVVDAVIADYRLSVVVGDYHVYVPKPVD